MGAAAVGGGDVGHAAVGAPEDSGAVEFGAGLVEVAAGEPGAEDGGDRLPVAVALLFHVQVDAEGGF